jgi:ketosteroid isomerase-like protein
MKECRTPHIFYHGNVHLSGMRICSRSGILRHSPWIIAASGFLFDSTLALGLRCDTHMRRKAHLPSSLVSPATAVLLLLCLMGVTSTPAHALPHRENHAIHKEIETLEEQWRQAVIANDVTRMDHLLADDYIGISANGTVETKTQALAQRKAGTVVIKKLDIDDIKVRLYGDTAVVTSQAELQGSNGQADIGGRYRYTRVYNRRFGQWKIVSFEASRMHDADARAKN